MTEHVHEWNIAGTPAMFVIVCSKPDCAEELTIDEAEARLNATERLGLEWARQFVEDCGEAMETTSGVTMEIYRSDIELLRAYAATLEAK